MSRVGKNPVVVPKGVEFKISSTELTVKGPLGTLTQFVGQGVSVKQDSDKISFVVLDDSKQSNAMSGTMRALVQNMVQGVSKGFEKKLMLVGVGYRAQAQGEKLNLSLGFSHPVVHTMPKGVTVATPTQTEVLIKGIDKQQVGQVAAEVRAYRPPEPYKGKGIRYSDETVVLKETKKK